MVGLREKVSFMLAATLLPLGGSAHAAVAEPHGNGLFAADHAQLLGWNTLSGFDLAMRKAPFAPHAVGFHSRGARPASISGLDAVEAGFTQHGTSVTGPSWSYQQGASGPVLELAALGAGKKGRPKLVHVALDWSF